MQNSRFSTFSYEEFSREDFLLIDVEIAERGGGERGSTEEHKGRPAEKWKERDERREEE